MVNCTKLTSAEEICALRDYLLLDLETTGQDPELDGIFELGMVRVIDGRIVNQARTFADPLDPLPAQRAQEAGVTQEMLHKGLSSRQLAASLSGLLLGNVAVATARNMAFVTALLKHYNVEGELCYVDICGFAADLAGGELPDRSVEAMAALYDLEAEGDRPVLRRCVLQQRLLERCVAISLEPPPPEEEEEEAPPPPKKRRLTFKRPVLPLRKAKRRRKKKKKKKKSAPITDAEILYCVAAGIALAAAMLSMPSLSGILFVISAVVLLPVRYLRKLLERHGFKSWMVGVLGGLLFAAAFLLRPSAVPAQRQGEDDYRIPAYIVLSADETGSYGKWIREGQENAYIAFYIPSGVYRVLNNNPDAATVSVHPVGEEEAEPTQAPQVEELEEDLVKTVDKQTTITVLGSKSQTLTVEEENYVTLSKGSKNVIFQYLSAVPEVVVTDNAMQSNGAKVVKLAYVNGTEVRMRRSPSVGAYIMATYDTGKEVEVTGVAGEWTAVRVDGREGYIYSRFLTNENPLAAQTQEAADGQDAEAPPDAELDAVFGAAAVTKSAAAAETAAEETAPEEPAAEQTAE